jgi:cytochrome c-type biogenesis protein CcmH
MKRLMIFFVSFIFLLSAFATNIYAASSVESDSQIEARLKALSSELRCLVCQNTTLADSSAPLAEDLRNEIRVLMHQGKSDEEVKAYLVDRYGDFVLYRPPMQSNTMLLWFGPFIMLLVGAITLFFVLKKRANSTEYFTKETPGDDDE